MLLIVSVCILLICFVFLISGQIINTAINANFDQFINELRPIIEKALSKFMLESAEKIVSSFPYDELFPLK